MKVWRVCKAKWSASAFNGDGAALNPGRWNLEGERMVYCGESKALAVLEVLANAGNKRLLSEITFAALALELPEEMIEEVGELPQGWNAKPPGKASRAVGSAFLRSARKVALKVPTSILPGEFNYLLNPRHPDYAKLGVTKALKSAEEFRLDHRLTQ